MRAPPCLVGLFVCSLCFAVTCEVRADEPATQRRSSRSAPASADPTGVVRAASKPSDLGRAALNALLYLPRKTVELGFLATGTAAAILRDEQIVPRVEELLSPRPGQLSAFPVILLESRRAPSLGASMLASGTNSATGMTIAFGGTGDMLGEGRVRYGLSAPIPVVLAVDALFDTRSRLEYRGVGQTPEEDSRNRFRPSAATRTATYAERRSRAILSLGARIGEDLELFASTSVAQSRVQDPPDADPSALSRVFEPDSVPGAFAKTTLVYTELALRLDTRRLRGRPSPGMLLEGYAGVGAGIEADAAHYFRTGGRAAAFIPIRFPSNILSPRITLDTLEPTARTPIPFNALLGQPDFRGFDTLRDKISCVASLDYRWALSRFVAPRIFVDVAAVAPELAQVFAETPRIAAGLGLDLFSPSTETGQFAVAFTSDGFRLLISFGRPTSFGDRQHRD